MGPTAGIAEPGAGERVRKIRLDVVEGAAKGASFVSSGTRCSIGSAAGNDLVIADDPTVSRFHCEVAWSAQGMVLRDLESTNGTILDGVRVAVAHPRGGSTIRLGHSVVRLELERAHSVIALYDGDRFGQLVGASPAMRAMFALLDRAAKSDATVLLEGETGTGKELAARAIHAASPRAGKPFIVIDCGAIADNLLESELFGHEKGAFTGADAKRVGAFEDADGGTIFLDEIGELPSALQPKLLRVLERKEIRRVGANAHRAIDVRIVAATHRDLRAQVNTGGFREDLYYRLCVLHVPIPPLRGHPEDLAPLVASILEALGAGGNAKLVSPTFVASLARYAWPGNVRELRNFLERCVVLDEALPVGAARSTPSPLQIDTDASYDDNRKAFLEQFEREFAAAMLARHNGNVTLAAKASGIGRVYFHRLLKRRGLK